jgi:hypothetical protein
MSSGEWLFVIILQQLTVDVFTVIPKDLQHHNWMNEFAAGLGW